MSISQTNKSYSKKNKNTKKTKKNRSNHNNSNKLSIMSNNNQKELESKYCSCLKKVSEQKVDNPYGICTSAIFTSRQSVRDKVVDCSQYEDYNKMTVRYLRKKAKAYKVKKYSRMKKKELVKKLLDIKKSN